MLTFSSPTAAHVAENKGLQIIIVSDKEAAQIVGMKHKSVFCFISGLAHTDV